MSLVITNLRTAENIKAGGNFIVYDAGADTIATVMAAGYFNGADSHLNVGDVIQVTHADGVTNLTVSAKALNSITVIGDASGEQVIAIAGAIDLLNPISLVESGGGGQAMTLANGLYIGQRKVIVHDVDGGNLVVTLATATVNTITMTTLGESVELMWTTTGWAIIGFGGLSASLPAFTDV
jgi:hypothetical protein